MTTILSSVLPQVFHHFTVVMGTNLPCFLPLRKRSPVLLPLHSLTGCDKTPTFYVSMIKTVQVSPLVRPASLPPPPPHQLVNRSPVYAVMWVLGSRHRGHEKHLLLGPRPVNQVSTADKGCPMPAWWPALSFFWAWGKPPSVGSVSSPVEDSVVEILPDLSQLFQPTEVASSVLEEF